MRVIEGDCLAVMAGMEPESVHAVITDPPYELGFMGRAWDKSGIAFSVEVWCEALRVLKPGGYLLAFGGARTFHRMVVAIEDAGFVILPMIGWIYGSGFPKAADVGKGIDREAGAEREVVGTWKPTGTARPGLGGGGHSCGKTTSADGYHPDTEAVVNITSPSTPAAVKWDGWKYSISPLKPALEPVCMAQKPYDGRPLASIQRHEVGAVNVDGCRVPTARPVMGNIGDGNEGMFGMGSRSQVGFEVGRFPPNLCLSPEAARVVGRQSGESEPSKSSCRGLQHSGRHGGLADIGPNIKEGTNTMRGHDDNGGSAARFFPTFDHYPEPPFLYCPKAGRGEREAGLAGMKPKARPTLGNGIGGQPNQQIENNLNIHPTVKPIALMRWLIRLVTREGQTVLDPFTGSGSTGCAAALERRAFIGIEREPEYVAIATARIKYWAELPQQMPLFAEEEP